MAAYLELADYLLIAERVLGLPAEATGAGPDTSATRQAMVSAAPKSGRAPLIGDALGDAPRAGHDGQGRIRSHPLARWGRIE